jgi:hypothetical protein
VAPEDHRSTAAAGQKPSHIGFGAATRGGAGRIECGGGVDPRVLVLYNQRQQPGWLGLAGIVAGGGGDVGDKQGHEKGDSERWYQSGPIDRVDLDWLASRVGLLGQSNGPFRLHFLGTNL